MAAHRPSPRRTLAEELSLLGGDGPPEADTPLPEFEGGEEDGDAVLGEAPVVGYEIDDHDLRCLKEVRDGNADKVPQGTLDWLGTAQLVRDGTVTELGLALLGE